MITKIESSSEILQQSDSFNLTNKNAHIVHMELIARISALIPSAADARA
jgi:hypothetical protein